MDDYDYKCYEDTELDSQMAMFFDELNLNWEYTQSKYDVDFDLQFPTHFTLPSLNVVVVNGKYCGAGDVEFTGLLNSIAELTKTPVYFNFGSLEYWLEQAELDVARGRSIMFPTLPSDDYDYDYSRSYRWGLCRRCDKAKLAVHEVNEHHFNWCGCSDSDKDIFLPQHGLLIKAYRAVTS